MTTAESHLLEILNCIFKSECITDEKNWFKKWITKWIVDKNSVQQVFNNNNVNNDKIYNRDKNKTLILQLAHNTIAVKYSQCYITYNYEFISDLLFYVSTVYYNFFNKKSNELKECITLLNNIKQNMFYEYSNNNNNNTIDIYPKTQDYKNKFENYGRAFMKYYNSNRIPFIIQALLYNNIQEEEDIDKLKIKIFHFITFITSNKDKEWLEFLHGPLLDIHFAMYQHNVFCDKYQENNEIWFLCKNSIIHVINDINDYLNEIYRVIFHEKFLTNKSTVTDICFPTISKIDFNDNCQDYYNYNKNPYKDYYYDKNTEMTENIPILDSTFSGKHYERILQNVFPSLIEKISIYYSNQNVKDFNNNNNNDSTNENNTLE